MQLIRGASSGAGAGAGRVLGAGAGGSMPPPAGMLLGCGCSDRLAGRRRQSVETMVLGRAERFCVLGRPGQSRAAMRWHDRNRQRAITRPAAFHAAEGSASAASFSVGTVLLAMALRLWAAPVRRIVIPERRVASRLGALGPALTAPSPAAASPARVAFTAPCHSPSPAIGFSRGLASRPAHRFHPTSSSRMAASNGHGWLAAPPPVACTSG